MAWLEQHPTSGQYHLCFRWNGQKKRRTLATPDRKSAEAILLRFEENLTLLERGRLELPVDADIVTFLLSDGKLARSPQLTIIAPRTLGEIVERYFAAVGNGSVEANTLATLKLHLGHVQRKFGQKFPLQRMTVNDLQNYVNSRVRRIGEPSNPLSTVTLRKELASLRACFNWAVQTGLLVGAFPNKGLRFPKGDEKRPFMTWEEIERRVSRGGLSADETNQLWDCLFLDLGQVEEFLKYVKVHGSRPWVYPMCVAAAFTGARRSELARIQVDDLDWSGQTVLIHERKRVRGRRSTRRIPLTPVLESVLSDWLKTDHPGGRPLFCESGPSFQSVTAVDAGVQFRSTVRNSKWDVLRGWHVFRHSFASNLAAKGVDQRFIDEFLGHQTEEQRRRYRHLFPHQQRRILHDAFGPGS
jgi:integrase